MSQLVDSHLERQFEKLPPHSIPSEMCLIASLALDRDERTKVLPTIKRDIFFQTDHQIFFDVIRSLHDAGKSVDWLTIREEMIRRDVLAECGGLPYISELIHSVPSAAHCAHYAAIVQEKSRLRSIISLANDALRRCYAPADNDASEEIANTLAASAAGIAITGSDVPIHHISDVMNEVLASFDEKKPRRIPTGISDLDHCIGGLPVGGFVLVGGRPGMGKSQIGKQWALNIAGMGLPVGIVTVEEERKKIAENYLSQESGVENRLIAYRRLRNGDVDQIIAAMPRLAELPLWIVDAAHSLASIEAAVTILATKHKCKMIFVDYLQLIDGGAARYENKNIEVGKISNGLKHLFKKLDVAGVGAVQLNRSGNEAEEAMPSLQRLRDSGTLEQDGDLILLLWRKDYYHMRDDGYQFDDKLVVIVAKNKSGPAADIPLYFDGAHQTIKNYGDRPSPHIF